MHPIRAQFQEIVSSREIAVLSHAFTLKEARPDPKLVLTELRASVLFSESNPRLLHCFQVKLIYSQWFSPFLHHCMY